MKDIRLKNQKTMACDLTISPKKPFHERLQEVRLRTNRTIKEVAEEVGEYTQQIRRWEDGEQSPTVKSFAALHTYYKANVPGYSADQLFD